VAVIAVAAPIVAAAVDAAGVAVAVPARHSSGRIVVRQRGRRKCKEKSGKKNQNWE
jgi:hypothetical protein